MSRCTVPAPRRAVLRSVRQSLEPRGDGEVITSTVCKSALALWSLPVAVYMHFYCPWINVATPGMLKSLYFHGGEFIPFTLFCPDLLLHSNFYASWLSFKFCCVCLICKTRWDFVLCSQLIQEKISGFLLIICCTNTNEITFFFFFLLSTGGPLEPPAALEMRLCEKRYLLVWMQSLGYTGKLSSIHTS